MSAHQLRDPGFLDLVEQAVAGLGENQLVLEMTETVVVPTTPRPTMPCGSAGAGGRTGHR